MSGIVYNYIGHIRIILVYSLQKVENEWLVKSETGLTPNGYLVEQLCLNCSLCANDADHVCTKDECGFLCTHIYKCSSSCYDFNNGKHI